MFRAAPLISFLENGKPSERKWLFIYYHLDVLKKSDVIKELETKMLNSHSNSLASYK